MAALKEQSSWSLIEASAISGVVTRALLHPIDTCKVVTQTSNTSSPVRGVLSTSTAIFKEHGMRGLYRGFPVALAGTVPGVTLYFYSYNFFKTKLDGHLSLYPNLSNFTAGFLAEVFSCVVWVPTDVLKERLQASTTRSKSSQALEGLTFREVARAEGFTGLYRGYGATLASFGPFSAFYFMFVEQLKHRYRDLTKKQTLDFHELMPLCAIAGGAAALCSAPMDLVKVRMQVDRKSSYRGFLHALADIWQKEGSRGLFRGGGSRVWFAVPNTAITMSVMESIKHRLD